MVYIGQTNDIKVTLYTPSLVFVNNLLQLPFLGSETQIPVNILITWRFFGVCVRVFPSWSSSISRHHCVLFSLYLISRLTRTFQPLPLDRRILELEYHSILEPKIVQYNQLRVKNLIHSRNSRNPRIHDLQNHAVDRTSTRIARDAHSGTTPLFPNVHCPVSSYYDSTLHLPYTPSPPLPLPCLPSSFPSTGKVSS
jgi:hypothetical protein